jgi:hypothetical protein
MEHSDYFDVNQTAIPDAVLLTGNVRKTMMAWYSLVIKLIISGKLYKSVWKRATKKGDFILNSKYAEYSGNVKKAFATGEAFMSSI